jgi:hypothetical protein
MGAIVLFKILIPNANVPLNPDVVFLQTRMLIDGHRDRPMASGKAMNMNSISMSSSCSNGYQSYRDIDHGYHQSNECNNL